jgi:hypothetical protein
MPAFLLSREVAVDAMTQPKPTELAPQIDRFRDLARELECDEDEDAFDERLKKLAKSLKHDGPPKGDQGQR